MSRSSWFIGVGTLFTLSATLVASQMLLPITVNRSEGFVLATALVLSACYLWFGGLFKEPVLEYSAYLVHLTVPLVWLDCLASANGINATATPTVHVLFAALIGCSLLHNGISLDREMSTQDQMAKAAQPVSDFLDSAAKSLTSTGSGKFRPQLATDSGAFRL